MNDQKDTVEKYFNKIDTATFDEAYFNLFTNDVELYYPKFGYAKGKEGIKKFGEVMNAHLKELHYNFETFNYIISENTFAVEGNEKGITKEGKTFPDDVISFGKFCNVFEFENNLIKRIHVYVDPDFTSEDADRIAIFSRKSMEKMNIDQETKEVIDAFYKALSNKNLTIKREKLEEIFADEVDWDMPGNKDKFSWLGMRNSKAEVLSFFEEHSELVEPINFEIEFTAINGENAVAIGQLSSKILENNKVYNSEFAIILKVKQRKIIKYHFMEDSYKLNELIK